jgi:Protein of unknown function (DUF4230)
MYYDDDHPRSSGCVPAALIIAIALLAVAGIFYFGINRAAGALNPFNSASKLNPLAPQPTTINIDRPAVIREIRGSNRLETAVASIDKVIEAGQQGNSLYNLLVGDKLLLVAHGQVIAGFDLAKLHDEDIILSSDGVTATITLPPAEILVSRLDNSKTYVYGRQRGLLTKGNIGLESQARQVAEQEIVRAACDDDLLKRAAGEGQQRMTALVRALGFKQVTVNASPGPCMLPDGQPLPPPAATPISTAP